MAANKERLEKFETEIIKKEKPDFFKNLKIIEAMYQEAVSLKVIPLKDPLDGIEVDLKIAKVINSVSETS